MKIKFKIIVSVILALNSSDVHAGLYDLSNDQLAKDLGTSKNMNQLKHELKSENAGKWIARCLNDEHLKEYIYIKIFEIGDDHLRNDVLIKYMRDHEYWEQFTDINLKQARLPYMAGDLSDCIWIHFPSLKSREADRMALSYTLQTRQGRDAFAAIYERFLALPEEERKEENPKVAALISEIKSIFLKYGTLEFLRPNVQRQPDKETSKKPPQADHNSSIPSSAITKSERKEAAPEGNIPWWWILSTLAAIVATALFMRSRQWGRS